MSILADFGLDDTDGPGEWDYEYEVECETIEEARARMSEEEVRDDQRYELLGGCEPYGDPFTECGEGGCRE